MSILPKNHDAEAWEKFLKQQLEIKSSKTDEDIVNHPLHYHSNGIDVIGFSELQFDKMELRGFYRINVIKYVTRFHKKNKQQDLEKAMFYLKKLIEMEGSES